VLFFDSQQEAQGVNSMNLKIKLYAAYLAADPIRTLSGEEFIPSLFPSSHPYSLASIMARSENA
jgi:hypothetical protein